MVRNQEDTTKSLETVIDILINWFNVPIEEVEELIKTAMKKATMGGKNGRRTK